MQTRLFTLLIALAGMFALPQDCAAEGRHYYNSWSYYPQRTYYYVYYYYRPYDNSDDYNYHYCIYYPSTPRYIYYYNPYTKFYWGRYDLQDKGYSMLAEKDRKSNLKEIPETAFPKPAEMPAIPESKDGEKMLPPPKPPAGDPKDLP